LVKLQWGMPTHIYIYRERERERERERDCVVRDLGKLVIVRQCKLLMVRILEPKFEFKNIIY
jgi:hypothetical protein